MGTGGCEADAEASGEIRQGDVHARWFLVPSSWIPFISASSVRTGYRDFARSEGEDRLPFSRLARFFKVSTLVILRRLHDAGALSRDEMWQAYHLVVSTLEGQTLHRDAFRLLGFSKLETFRELGHSLGRLMPYERLRLERARFVLGRFA